MPAGDVLQFTVLKKQPRSEEALLLLRQIASVSPLPWEVEQRANSST